MTYEEALAFAAKNAPNPIAADQIVALLQQHEDAKDSEDAK